MKAATIHEIKQELVNDQASRAGGFMPSAGEVQKRK